MKVLLWGGAGQAKVLRPILEAQGHSVVAIFDRDPAVQAPFTDIKMIHTDAERKALVASHRSEPVGFVVAIGGHRGRERTEVGDCLVTEGLVPLTSLHATSWVAESAKVGLGSQILAMSGVGEFAHLGEYCILNTNSTVDHETTLGVGVHVMPGATLAGEVNVGDFATIGANATVLPRLRIGTGAFVGAGAVVTVDVPADTVVVGNPARPLRGS